MKTINASDFKTRCLAILDVVAKEGTPIEITKRGKPIACLVPTMRTSKKYPQEELRGSVTILGDIIEPALSLEEWETLSL